MIRRLYLRTIVLTLAGLLIAGHFALKLVPIPPALLRPPIQSIALLDRNGIPLRETRVAERFSHELTLSEVPRSAIAAVLAAPADALPVRPPRRAGEVVKPGSYNRRELSIRAGEPAALTRVLFGGGGLKPAATHQDADSSASPR